MKPIKIVMSAFGSYPDYTEINFEQFGKKGLFLITGPTGAGKTTIFDAICYALYGSASGEYRDASLLRNENATGSTKTFVEFWFSHQGKNYHVVRNPEYLRNKDRGTGTTNEKANAVLYEGDKPVASGPRDVGKAVLELLNVKETQFKQIVMIAQGEFRKVLNASTKERTEILRNIFSTEGYNSIGEDLRNRRSDISKQVETIENSILQYLAGAKTQEESPSGAELRSLTEAAGSTGSVWNAPEITGALEKVIEEDEELLKSAGEEFTEAKKAEEAVSAELSRAELNNGLIRRVEELEREAAELEKQREQITQLKELTDKRKRASRIVAPAYDAWHKSDAEKSRLIGEIDNGRSALSQLRDAAESASELAAKEEQRRPEAERLARDAELILSEKDKYHERDELRTELNALKEAERRAADKSAELERREKELSDKISELKVLAEELKNRPEEKRTEEIRKKDLDELFEELTEITDTQVPACRSKSDQLKELRAKADAASEKYEKGKEAREAAEHLFSKSQLGLLAKDLKDGEKCPVCGSIHHPEPAMLPDESVTAMMLEGIREQEENLRSARDTAVVNMETAAAELRVSENNLINSIVRYMPESAGEKDIDRLIEMASDAKADVQRRISETSDLISMLDKDCKKLTQAQEDLGKASGEETEKLNQDKAAHQKQLEELHIKAAEKTAKLGSLESLRYEDWKSAEEAKNTFEKSAKEILGTIEASSAAKQKALNAVTDKEAEIRTNTESLDRVTAEADKQYADLEKILEANGFASSEEMLTYRKDESEITESETTIADYDQKVVSNSDQLRQAKLDAEGKTLTDEEQLKAQLEECRIVTEKANNDLTGIRFRIETNSGILDKVQTVIPELEKKKKEYAVNDRLYRLVSGQISGTGRITLEQYVQMSSFDRIINAANRRMYPLSNKQYELRRRTQFKGLGAGEYLDLDVLCVSNGKRRPAGNVSGGESFLASLSLALGLSDTISSDMGGVQMDALFIDEGFGSLDAELLDTTLGVLLNQSGPDKLIGIISHREELGDIPQKIKVSKDSYGSRVEIELES